MESHLLEQAKEMALRITDALGGRGILVSSFLSVKMKCCLRSESSTS